MIRAGLARAVLLELLAGADLADRRAGVAARMPARRADRRRPDDEPPRPNLALARCDLALRRRHDGGLLPCAVQDRLPAAAVPVPVPGVPLDPRRDRRTSSEAPAQAARMVRTMELLALPDPQHRDRADAALGGGAGVDLGAAGLPGGRRIAGLLRLGRAPSHWLARAAAPAPGAGPAADPRGAVRDLPRRDRPHTSGRTARARADCHDLFDPCLPGRDGDAVADSARRTSLARAAARLHGIAAADPCAGRFRALDRRLGAGRDRIRRARHQIRRDRRGLLCDRRLGGAPRGSRAHARRVRPIATASPSSA